LIRSDSHSPVYIGVIVRFEVLLDVGVLIYVIDVEYGFLNLRRYDVEGIKKILKPINMPSYIQINQLQNSGSGSGNCCCDSIDGNASIFFSNLAQKLLDMSKAIEKRIEDLSNKVCLPESKGFLIASIETPSMMLGVNYEFVEYIKQYGPPQKGKFDPILLEKIRKELGIVSVVV